MDPADQDLGVADLKHKRLPKTKKGLLNAAAELREKAARLEAKANLISDLLPPEPEGFNWIGPLKPISNRFPISLSQYLDTISAYMGVKTAPVLRRVINLGLAQIHDGLPEDLREELDKLRKP